MPTYNSYYEVRFKNDPSILIIMAPPQLGQLLEGLSLEQTLNLLITEHPVGKGVIEFGAN